MCVQVNWGAISEQNITENKNARNKKKRARRAKQSPSNAIRTMKKEDYKYGFFVRERESIKLMACAATICAENFFEIETNVGDGEKKAAATAADTTTNENLNRIL